MSKTVTVAALQRAYSGERDADIAATAALARQAAAEGAQIILPSELFEGHYFCTAQDEAIFATAAPLATHPAVEAMREVARTEQVYIPASFYERDGHHYYNSIAMIDDQGAVMGTYRKSHIPDGPGYMEKFYFRPGNSGFKVWETRHATIGVGICWDQWYPETARAMMLMGAELLFFPTAIGNEPHDPELDTRRLWVRAMVGHAVSNVVPVIAANRTGTENAGTPREAHFYGNSFIADHRGDMAAELGTAQEGVITATFNLDQIARHRAAFGFFRDRRPNLYGRLSEDR
ncbi:N-carbamoylputrescine amidase [Sandaracinobacteroides saxicola]|uniref:N-carbamoylputrescine amidase n=1 Tax=Sandaracinobacteroides saxicola TaxID=2759707 RepID=A0A7G5IKN4_9SPHN|nr:N-carbamoylputrescine amidase [Sandaracinobacteroides saxicola]QMW23926.1 N-carbamoylputrescine amidase [Sandaracinobacteroides saxicola]